MMTVGNTWATAPATKKQIDQLVQLGLIAPPSSQTCESLLHYITKGERGGLKTREARIKFFRHQQKRWIGQRVAMAGRPMIQGTVRYIKIKPNNFLRFPGQRPKNKEPRLEATIDWDTGGRQHHTVGISQLILVKEKLSRSS